MRNFIFWEKKDVFEDLGRVKWEVAYSYKYILNENIYIYKRNL